MTFTIGSTATFTHVVQAKDLATNWQNNVEVLATPILLWLAEITCMKAIESELAQGIMTVGVGHEMKHLAPTPPGFTLKVTATLIAVQGRSMLFEVTAEDGYEQVLAGRHERAWVNTEKFLSRVQAKKEMEARA